MAHQDQNPTGSYTDMFFKTFFLFLAFIVITPAASAADQADIRRLAVTGDCDGCDLSNANLKGLQLFNISLRWANLSGADLRGSVLDLADLTGADLSNARLDNSRIRGGVLEGANLMGVALDSVALSGSDLRWSNLSHLDADLDLEFLDLVGVLLEGARFKHGVRCAQLPGKGGWGCAAQSNN